MSTIVRYYNNALTNTGYYCIYNVILNLCETDAVEYVSTARAIRRVYSYTELNARCPSIRILLCEPPYMRAPSVSGTCRAV